jgi:hypothetical protein
MPTGNAIRAGAVALLIALGLANPAAAEPSGTFAFVSDIHFNPFDPPALAPSLAAADVAGWPAAFATVTGEARSPHGEDTNHPLLASALAAVAATAASADFAVVTGDFLALGPSADPALVAGLTVKTTLFVAEGIAAALPGKPVFLALGNNDSSCGDYRIEPGGSYLAETKEIVRRLAGPDRVAPDFDRTYAAGGYYAANHPTVADTLIVSVNDVLWSKNYQDACGADGAAAGAAMLDWLRGVLAAQKAAGGHVWMIHHIPWGIDPYSTDRASHAACPATIVPFMKEPFASGFLALLRDYAGVITASFSGHVHFDDYRLLAGASGRTVLVDKIAPAISPVFGQNPGFQMFDYDAATGAPTDFSTWYLANLEDDAPADWLEEYRFSEAYDVPGYSAAAVDTVAGELAAAGPARDTFRRLYNVGHGALSPVAFPAYLCAITAADPAAFDACYCGG